MAGKTNDNKKKKNTSKAICRFFFLHEINVTEIDAAVEEKKN